MQARVRIDFHCAKFEAPKPAPFVANAFLSEKDRASGGKLNQDRDERADKEPTR